MTTINDYMELDYKINVKTEKDFDDSEYFVATYVELKGLEGIGNTEKEAAQDLETAKEIWFQVMLENNEGIPLPRN